MVVVDLVVDEVVEVVRVVTAGVVGRSVVCEGVVGVEVVVEAVVDILAFIVFEVVVLLARLTVVY